LRAVGGSDLHSQRNLQAGGAHGELAAERQRLAILLQDILSLFLDLVFRYRLPA
jgi:hypothetical protein